MSMVSRHNNREIELNKAIKTIVSESVVVDRLSKGFVKVNQDNFDDFFQRVSFLEAKKQMAESGSVCSVCLMEMEEGQAIRKLVDFCQHVFHEDCIRKYSEKNPRCPLCKTLLNDKYTTQKSSTNNSQVFKSTLTPQSSEETKDIEKGSLKKRDSIKVESHLDESRDQMIQRKKTTKSSKD